MNDLTLGILIGAYVTGGIWLGFLVTMTDELDDITDREPTVMNMVALFLAIMILLWPLTVVVVLLRHRAGSGDD